MLMQTKNFMQHDLGLSASELDINKDLTSMIETVSERLLSTSAKYAKPSKK